VGILRWQVLTRVKSEPHEIYEVSLVDAVQTANSASSGAVQPAVYTPEGQPTADNVPEVTQKESAKAARDFAATIKIRSAEAKPGPVAREAQSGPAHGTSGTKGSRFAIDAPPGESTADPIGDLEARGAVSQPLHVTHPGPYSEKYVLLRQVRPAYPQHERERGIEGAVTVELLVDTEGNVAHADVLELVGPESFKRAALDAVRQFEFQPPVENGEPSTMWIKFVIKFRINGQTGVPDVSG
jgi:TonB family protein